MRPGVTHRWMGPLEQECCGSGSSCSPLADSSKELATLAELACSGVGPCQLLLVPAIKFKEHLTHQSPWLPLCGQVTICRGHGICGPQVQVPTLEDGWSIPKHPLLNSNQMSSVSQSLLQVLGGCTFWQDDLNGQWLLGFEGRFVKQQCGRGCTS